MKNEEKVNKDPGEETMSGGDCAKARSSDEVRVP
jgi:hypothetical protein